MSAPSKSLKSAAAVSRFLATKGIRPLPSGTSRMREGVRVSGSLGTVSVSVDLDSDRDAKFLTDEIVAELVAAGVAHVRVDDSHVRVSA